MWRKQSEPVASPSLPEPVSPPVAPVRSAAPERPAAPSPAVSTTAPGPEAARPEVTRIAQGIQIKGELSGRTDLYVDGRVEGTIRLSQSSVTVGPNGRVSADVEAREIVVRGTVKGNLLGRERVVLGNTGDVHGNVSTQRLAIEEGARFQGRVEMATPKQETSLVRATPLHPDPVAFQAVVIPAKEGIQ
jgi:cytoskeletal protein CcmA (bactofilin family)